VPAFGVTDKKATALLLQFGYKTERSAGIIDSYEIGDGIKISFSMFSEHHLIGRH
jgi:hypothetical protein